MSEVPQPLTPLDERQEIEDLLVRLEEEVESSGWDQPNRMWVILRDEAGRLYGTNEGNPFSYGTLGGMHPGELLETLYTEHGFRVHPDAVGVVVANEGYRHRTLNEIVDHPADETQRELSRQFRQLREVFSVILGEEELREREQRAWARVQHQMNGPASSEDSIRRELRSVVAVLQNGDSVGRIRTRAVDDLPEDVATTPWQDKELTLIGRIPAAMYQVLAWDRAERTHYDPDAMGEMLRTRKEAREAQSKENSP